MVMILIPMTVVTMIKIMSNVNGVHNDHCLDDGYSCMTTEVVAVVVGNLKVICKRTVN